MAASKRQSAQVDSPIHGANTTSGLQNKTKNSSEYSAGRTNVIGFLSSIGPNVWHV